MVCKIIVRCGTSSESTKHVCFAETALDEKQRRRYNMSVSHAIMAQERIQEFSRLKRARYLLDAISLTNELLADSSDVEILSLANIIIQRLKYLGVSNISLDGSNISTNKAKFNLSHTGVYHCCTFCSSGGKKEAICGCGGTMPGGYQGCGHGHKGHPGIPHWSCCGSILRYGCCLALQRYMHQLLF